MTPPKKWKSAPSWDWTPDLQILSWTTRCCMRFYARLFIKPEVTDRFCWFLAANTGWRNSISCPNLKKIWQKLRPWECPGENVRIGCHDVIEFEMSKSKKTDLANICQIISRKFHQNWPIPLRCRASTQTYRVSEKKVDPRKTFSSSQL